MRHELQLEELERGIAMYRQLGLFFEHSGGAQTSFLAAFCLLF